MIDILLLAFNACTIRCFSWSCWFLLIRSNYTLCMLCSKTGVSGNSGANYSYNFSAHQSYMLCLWPDRWRISWFLFMYELYPIIIDYGLLMHVMLNVILSGSGKTYTMQPLPLRAAEDLVRMLHQPVYQNQRFKLWLSYFEIYGGKLFDLLSDRKWVFLMLCYLEYFIMIWLFILIHLVYLVKCMDNFSEGAYYSLYLSIQTAFKILFWCECFNFVTRELMRIWSF